MINFAFQISLTFAAIFGIYVFALIHGGLERAKRERSEKIQKVEERMRIREDKRLARLKTR